VPPANGSSPGSEDEPQCPQCFSTFMDRVNLKPGFRAFSQCSKCNHIEIVVEGGAKQYGKIHPPAKPEPAQEVPDRGARRSYPQINLAAARRGGGKASRLRRSAEGAQMNRGGIEFTLVQVEPDLWQWQFRIGETVTTGKTKTELKGKAVIFAPRIDFLKGGEDGRTNPFSSSRRLQAFENVHEYAKTHPPPLLQLCIRSLDVAVESLQSLENQRQFSHCVISQRTIDGTQ
jgi:hypothetical protein